MDSFTYSLSDPAKFEEANTQLLTLRATGMLSNYDVRLLKGAKGPELCLEERQQGFFAFFKRLFDKSYNLNSTVQTLLSLVQEKGTILKPEITGEFLRSIKVICETANAKWQFRKIDTAPIAYLEAAYFKSVKNVTVLASNVLRRDRIVKAAPILQALKNGGPASGALAFIALRRNDPETARAFFSGDLLQTQLKPVVELLHAPPETWLRAALQKHPEYGAAFIESAILPFLEKETPLAQQFERLKPMMVQGTFERAPQSHADVFLFALFCLECSRVSACGEQLLLAKDTGLNRDVFVDWTARSVAILADTSRSSLQAEGAYKKIANAVRLPLDNLSKEAAEIAVAARLIPPSAPTAQKTLKELAKEHEKEVRTELDFHRTLEDLPGVAKVYGVTHITSNLQGGKVAPTVIMYRKAHNGSLEQCSREKRAQLNVKKCVHDFIGTIRDMHKKGVVHFDLKPDNLLIDQNMNLMVTDFGFAAYSTAPALNNSYVGKNNYYPAKWFGAPELLFRDPRLPKFGKIAKEADYLRAEDFTAGCLAYNLYFGGTNPPWSGMIMNHVRFYGHNAHFSQAEKDQIKKMMQDTIEIPLANLLKIKESARTQDDHYRFAIFNMMRIDPTQRWSAAQAKTYLETHAPLPH